MRPQQCRCPTGTLTALREGQPLGHLLCDEDLATIAVHAPVTGRLETYGSHRQNCDVSLAALHPYASRGDLLARIVAPHALGVDAAGARGSGALRRTSELAPGRVARLTGRAEQTASGDCESQDPRG